MMNGILSRLRGAGHPFFYGVHCHPNQQADLRRLNMTWHCSAERAPRSELSERLQCLVVMLVSAHPAPHEFVENPRLVLGSLIQ